MNRIWNDIHDGSLRKIWFHQILQIQCELKWLNLMAWTPILRIMSRSHNCFKALRNKLLYDAVYWTIWFDVFLFVLWYITTIILPIIRFNQAEPSQGAAMPTEFSSRRHRFRHQQPTSSTLQLLLMQINMALTETKTLLGFKSI